ncbi:hypothetical protein BH09PLA1_BH09PLA1_20170 [soil metagenome]
MQDSRINFARFKFHRVMDLPAKCDIYDFTRAGEAFRTPASNFAIGKYDEKRVGVYTTDLFGGVRDIHVGIDIGAPAGTDCRAFYDGVVLLQGYNPAAGDYGYTIISQHLLDGVPLFALWGHLSKSSIELRRDGDEFRAGDVIAHLGDRHENGGWNPHLHFQLSYERPTRPDMPGVVSAADRSRALEIYPDPRLVLGPLY